MKIITAISNPEINEKLKEYKEIEIIGKDIQYKEAIIELIEKIINIEIIILKENIPGQIEEKELIKKLQEKNIKIYYILENKKNKNEIKNIDKIFYMNKNIITEIIKNLNIKNEIEIQTNKINNNKIIKEKNYNFKKNNKIKDLILINNKIKKFTLIYNKIILNLRINKKLENKNKKIISVCGSSGSGKSTVSTNLAILSKYKKTLIIDFNLSNPNINIFFGIKNKIKNTNSQKIKINKKIDLLIGINLLEKIKKEKQKIIIDKIFNEIKNKYDFIILDIEINNKNELEKYILEKTEKIIIVTEPNLIGIQKANRKIKEYIFQQNIKKEKINILINKNNKNSISEEIIKNIFYNFEIVGKISQNNYYEYLINNNYKIINKKIKKEYANIIKKI